MKMPNIHFQKDTNIKKHYIVCVSNNYCVLEKLDLY